MIENSTLNSPLEATRPKRELGSATIALADKQGGGGVSAWITKARAEAQFRQRQQDARKQSLPSAESVDQHPEQSTAAETVGSYTVQMDSDNLAQEVAEGRVRVLENGLLDMVALLGSTHFRANWREEKVMPDLAAQGMPHYTPRMKDWNYELHPHAESLALSRAAVLAINIENRHLKDGSLGTMVEIGMAALSAALNGQKVIICFEKDLQMSLDEPGAVAQYRALRENLRHAQKLFPNLITLVREGDLDHFDQTIHEAMQTQRNPETSGQKIGRSTIERHEALKAERMADPLAFDVFGGSSGTFSKRADVVESFTQEQQQLQAALPNITPLNGPQFSGLWSYADAQPPERRAGAYYVAFKAEQPVKTDARVLVWSIQDEAVSKAAITELGFILLNALHTGQHVLVVMEPFNAGLYVETVFKEKASILRGQAETIIRASTDQNLPFDANQTQEVKDILTRLEDPDDQTSGADLLKLIKNSPILNKTQLYWDMDNARRTRSIIDAQMKRLQEVLAERKDEIGDPFFSFATSNEEYQQQVEQLKQRYDMKFTGPLFS